MRNLERIKILAAKSKSDKIKLDANVYLVDKTLGKSTSRVKVNDKSDAGDPVSIDILDQELKEFDSE